MCRVFKEAHVVDDDQWFRENREEDLRQFMVGWIYGGGDLYSVVLGMFDEESEHGLVTIQSWTIDNIDHWRILI